MENLKYLPQCRSEKGFTLLEVLVAIFITAIITTILYASLFQIIHTKEKVETELELLHEARMIFSRLSKDLRNTYPRGRVSGIATSYPGFYFKGEKDIVNEKNSRLSLASFTRSTEDLNENSRFSRQSDQSQVLYFLEKLDNQDQLYALVRRENPWFGNEQGGTQYAISERVSRFSVNYIKGKKLKNASPALEVKNLMEWNSGVSGSDYPKAVEIELVLRNNLGKDQLFSTTIFLPITK